MSAPTLRELCERATPGPWEACREDAIDYRPEQVWNPSIGSRVAVMSGGGPLRAVCGPEERANAQLIARCSPATMLAVVEFLEECACAEDRSNLDGDSAEVVLEQINDAAEKLLDILNATQPKDTP
jgi:hypothetical protein